MRILQLFGSGTIGTREMGPISTVVCELSNQFSLFGHEVTVVDPRSDLERLYLHSAVKLIEVQTPSGATLLRANAGHLGRRIRIWNHAFHYLRETARKISLEQFDAIHVHRTEVAMILKSIYGPGYFYTSHTPSWCLKRFGAQRPRPVLDSLRVASFSERCEARVIRNSRCTVALGDYLRRCCTCAPIAVIPNGLDLARWEPCDRREARARVGIKEGEFLLVYVGRIAPVKGVDVLVEAVRQTAAELKRLKVLVIGSLGGTFNLRNHVTQYAGKLNESAKGLPIRFLGFINNRSEEFRACLSAADVAVVPSRMEPQGLVALEALALGVPVIASDTGGLRSMITDDVGWVVPPGDVTALAERIRFLHEHPETLTGLREACRAHVAAHYTWEQTARRYLEVFAR